MERRGRILTRSCARRLSSRCNCRRPKRRRRRRSERRGLLAGGRDRARRPVRDPGRLVRGYRNRAGGTSRERDAIAHDGDAAHRRPPRRRHREPSRSRERRAGRARRQRPAREGDGDAGERHPHRAVPQRVSWCACGSTACCAPIPAPPDALPQALDLAHQDSRRPQYRRAAAAAGRRRAPARARSEIDIRVATMPTQHGESAVIRLLPRDRGLLSRSASSACSRSDERR